MQHALTDDSPTIPITDIPIYKNQQEECLSSLDYTLNKPFKLKSLKQNYKDLQAQFTVTKDFLFF